MSRHTTRLRRLRRLAVGLVAASLAVPAGVQATPDVRGEFSKSLGTSAQVTPGADVRGEFSRTVGTDVPGTAPAPAAAPSDAIRPTDGTDSLPYVVSALVLLAGLGAVAIAVPLTRRLRVNG